MCDKKYNQSPYKRKERVLRYIKHLNAVWEAKGIFCNPGRVIKELEYLESYYTKLI